MSKINPKKQKTTTSSNSSKLSLRKVKTSDWDYILKLRNDKSFRNNFYDQHTISKKEHYEYLNSQIDNPSFHNWTIIHNDHRVGYIRILNNDVSIIIEKKFQDHGFGSKALKLLEKEAKKLSIKVLVGRIMIDNQESEKIFLKNNYKLKMLWYEKNLK